MTWHTLEWDSLLPPPADVAHTEDCQGCELERLRSALIVIAEQQQKTLRMIRDNGFVFTDIGCEPGNWQHLAFSIYTDLCEVDMWARNGLGLSVGDPIELANEAAGP